MTTQELYNLASQCDIGWRNTHRRIGQHIPMECRACEAIHAAGFQDAHSGTVDAPTGYFYRVGRWVVVVDQQGFIDLRTFDTEDEASKDFGVLDDRYSEWEDAYVEL